MRRIHWLAAVFALFLLPTPALADHHEQPLEQAQSAQEPDETKKRGFSRRGFYVGVDFAYGFGSFYEDVIEDEVALSVSVDDAVGLNARVGYRLLPFLALEAHYEWMNEFTLQIAGVDTLDQSTHTLTGNLKLLLPTWRFQPYLLLGVGTQYYKLDGSLAGLGLLSRSDWVFAARPAVGVDLYLTRSLVFNVEVGAVIALSDLEASLSSIDTFPYISLAAGLQWRF